MTTCRLRTPDQAEAAQFVAEVKDWCACCGCEIYPESPDFAGGNIPGLGLVCFTHYMAEIESKESA